MLKPVYIFIVHFGMRQQSPGEPSAPTAFIPLNNHRPRRCSTGVSMSVATIPLCPLLLTQLMLQQWPSIHCHPIVDRQTPIILGWNNFFGPDNVIRTIAPIEQVQKCRWRCNYSEDPNDVSRAAAIVFHANGGFSPLPNDRRPEQLYVMFDLESPANSRPPVPTPDFFNLTMSYLADDEHNLHAPYGGIHRVNRSRREDLEDMWPEEEVLLRIRQKDKLVLQIVSNCAPQSGRDVYSKELAKHIDVTSYGRCFGHNCDRECYDREIDKHFFYLAFENSVCRNYVTEKFWNAFRHLTVPLVLSRSILKGLDIPQDAFIAVDDFESVGDMAKFLTELRNNQTRYLSYFNWTRFARRKSDVDPEKRAICRLCELAHKKLAPGSKMIVDMDKYWHEGGQCKSGFARNFVPEPDTRTEADGPITPLAMPAEIVTFKIERQKHSFAFPSPFFVAFSSASLILIIVVIRLLFHCPINLSLNRHRKFLPQTFL